jgi:prolyl-tRNA synthetase
MLGVPIRIEIGPKEVESKKIKLVRRDTKKQYSITEKELDKKIPQLAQDLLKTIRKKADQDLNKNIRSAKSLSDVKKILNSTKGFIRAPFCSLESDGEKCADILQEKTSGGKVGGVLFDKNEKATGKCIVCGKKAKEIVYIAKYY